MDEAMGATAGVTAGERLYPRILGAAFATLPRAVREAHESATLMRGTVTVERGDSILSRIAGVLAGFPAACVDAPCEVRFEPAGEGERWTRDMNGSIYVSTLTPANEPHCFDESFGLYAFRFRIHATSEGTQFELAGHTLCGIPLPRLLWPRIKTRESDAGGRYTFLAEARTFTGVLLVRYSGKLTGMADVKRAETVGGSAS